MEFVSAMCPQCNKETKVNPSEEVVFCEFCNKPFNVKEAIELHTEHIVRGKAAKKPSDDAMAKFNAILAQDYKLAETYLEDIIKKEYPPECKDFLTCGDMRKDWGSSPSFTLYNSLYDQQRDIELTERSLNIIHSVNPHIADMYYNILCAHVNALYITGYTKYDKTYKYNFSGKLAFLKIRLYDFNSNLDRITNNSLGLENNWDSIERNITQCKCYVNQDYDDEYIDNLIAYIKVLQITYRSWTDYHNIRHSKNYADILRDTGRNIYTALEKLESFYSPAKKAAIEKRREEERKRREEEECLEKERKYKEALEKEMAFWQQYIDLLKAGKAKKALALLQDTKRSSNTDEFAKFKISLFGVKYLGDVSLLQAKTLAELSLSKNH